MFYIVIGWIIFLFITLTHYVISENATHDSHIRYINDEEIHRIRTKARECEDSIFERKQKMASAIDAKSGLINSFNNV